jgi:hypothetical protein
METTFYRIVDEEFREGDANELTVSIVNNHVIAISRTLYLRRRIPSEGLSHSDVYQMSRRLGVTVQWLAVQLTQYESAVGPHVRRLTRPFRIITQTGELYYVTAETFAELWRQNREQDTAFVVRRLIHLRTVPDDEVCTICLQTKAEDPAKGWVKVGGCDRHCFHTLCILQYKSETCVNCRRQLNTVRF